MNFSGSNPISFQNAWGDDVFVERLWRSVKYEEVYRRAYETVSEARNSNGRYLGFYNGRRPHSSLDGGTPDQAYFNPLPIGMQPSPGRRSTYRRGDSVQTTGTSSDPSPQGPPDCHAKGLLSCPATDEADCAGQ